MRITTIGRELIRKILPEDLRQHADKPLDKKNLDELMTVLAQRYPDKYVDILQELNRIGEDTVTYYGREAAFSMRDLRRGKEVMAVNKKLREIVDNILDDDSLSPEAKEKKILELGYKYSQKVQDLVFDDAKKRRTAFASQIVSGSRGNKTQLMQLQFGNMLMKDALNRDIPYLSIDPYADGVSPTAAWVAASSGRKGFYDTQFATGQAGYLGKQVTNITGSTPIVEDDCGTTDTGIAFQAASPKNIGAVLLRPFHKYPAGTIVNEDMISEAGDDEEMLLRSPVTCKSHSGVCAKCSGLGENGRFPAIGDYVSLNAARSFVEPVTQGGIGSKHLGGVGGKKRTDDDEDEGDDQPTGFKSVDRLFNVPQNFPGGAVLASTEGRVNKIEKAPQGGYYITVGTKTHYAIPERKIIVKEGDNVTAGDMLTNGVPNPADIEAYKGLGDGRRYFVERLNKALKENGWGTDRRNVEQFTRSMLNKVRITRPDGYNSFLPGDLVDYDEVESTWTPSDSAARLPLQKAVGKYLEAPVLHYTIGTKVTPQMTATLGKHKFDTVLASDKAPPFEPEFVRAQAALANDKSWLTRLSGERLESSLFDATRRGMSDKWDSSSYVTKVVGAPYLTDPEKKV